MITLYELEQCRMAVAACGHLGNFAAFHGDEFGHAFEDDLECGYPFFNKAVGILVVSN